MESIAPATTATPGPGTSKHVKMSAETRLDTKGTMNRGRYKSVAATSALKRPTRGRREKRSTSKISGEGAVISPFVAFPPDAALALRLRQAARALVKPGLGILGADDSIRQIDETLKELKLANSDQNRWRWQEVFLGGDTELDIFLSGVLVREESISQALYRGKKLVNMVREKNLKLGIRMDKGLFPLAGTAGEYTSCGLDKLDGDCKRVKDKGAEFALWRCVYRVSPTTPSRLAIVENSNTLARFAVVCQNTGLVPILAAETLQEGRHDHVDAQGAMREILAGLAKALSEHHVYLEGTLVRVTAAAPGPCCPDPEGSLAQVAAGTARTINECLPPAIGGVVLAREHNLSRSIAILNEMQNCPTRKPFFVTFCFSQVLQSGLAAMWAGQDRNLNKTRAELMRKLKCCSLATLGQTPSDNVTLFTKTEFHY